MAALSAVLPRNAAIKSPYGLGQGDKMISDHGPGGQNGCYISCWPVLTKTNERVLGLGNNSGDRPFADFGFCNDALAFSLTIFYVFEDRPLNALENVGRVRCNPSSPE